MENNVVDGLKIFFLRRLIHDVTLLLDACEGPAGFCCFCCFQIDHRPDWTSFVPVT